MSKELLTRRDLLLDKQLEDISKRSIPSKEEQNQPDGTLTNSLIADINLRDLGIEEQLQKISRNSIKEVWGWKPTKIQSDITQEMVQEYQDELANSSYYDPITKRTLKYVPSNTDFTLESPELRDIVNESEIVDDLRQLTAQYKRTEQEIVTAYEAIQFIRNNEAIHGRDRKKLLGQFAEFEELPQIQELQRRIEIGKDRLIQIQGYIDGAENFRKRNKEALLENQAEIDRVNKANRILLKEKSDEINLLNRGKLNLKQQPNESDEEFKQRLLDVGQVEYDEEAVIQAAERRTIEKFKQNMKELTRNNTLVEQIIMIAGAESIFEYNKFFSLISTKFKEVYSRAKLTERDAAELVDFFNKTISGVSKRAIPDIDVSRYRELTREARAAETPRTEDALRAILDFEPPESVRRAASEEINAIFDLEQRALGGYYPEETLPVIPIKPVTTKPIGEEGNLLPVAEFRELGSPPTIGRAESIGAAEAIPFNPYEMSVAELKAEFGPRYNEGAVKGKLLTSVVPAQKGTDFYGNPILDSTGKQVFYEAGQATRHDILQRLIQRGIIGTPDTYEKSPQKKKIGRPIGSGFLEEVPKFLQFGKIAINPRALYYDNNLIVMKHNKHHLNGFNKTKVSDHFVNAMMKLLNSESPKHEDLKHFDLKEKELYDTVIHLAGLHKRVEHNLDRTKQAMKHRFDLLDGEINAGNDNKEIKKELKQLVHRMAFAGMITHHEAHQYLYPNMREKYQNRASKSKK